MAGRIRRSAAREPVEGLGSSSIPPRMSAVVQFLHIRGGERNNGQGTHNDSR